MAAGPVTDTDREAVRRLHGEGRPRNVIAREIGRSGSTVSKIAAELGLSFDRAETTAVATAARSADLASRRVDFATRLHDIAEREADKLSAPTLYWAWGGKDHKYAERVQPEPTPTDRRAIMSTLATALDRSLKLVPPKDDAAAESRSVIGDLMAGLARDYAERHGGPPPELAAPTDDGE